MFEEQTTSDPLPEDYYLVNFQYLLAYVADHYAHLLTSEELAFAQSFDCLSDAARMLYVRLIQRKGPLFRPDKLNYPEIDPLPDAIVELAEHSFIDYGEESPLEDLIDILTKPELLHLPEAEGLSGSLVRARLVEELIKRQVDLSGVERIRPLGHETLQLYKLLFFGNLYQDLTEFVLNDLGITPFESYSLDPEALYFDDRERVDDTLMLYHLDELSHEIIDQLDTNLLENFVDLIPDHSFNSHLSRRLDKIINRVARQFERLGRIELADGLYQQSSLAPARERRVRILFKQGQFHRCFVLCTEILDAPKNDQEEQFAIRFLNRHKHKAFEHFALPVGYEKFLNFSPCSSMVTIKQDPYKKVEQAACDWYAANGWKAYYVENALIVGLFGLAFWDVIFAPVPGAFFHPFQRGPSDLFAPEFQALRHEDIQRRMTEFHDHDHLTKLILSMFDKKDGIANYFVNWSVLKGTAGRNLIEKFLLVVDNKSLIQTFKRLLADPGGNSSGLPDLVVFNHDEFKLVEVKGPGDRLQDNQTRWLWHFSTCGIPAEVLYLDYA